mmetsp:Transcript_3118/g.10786  ORF Transcript_3118/g.10786 Transcript_3118/m.10786 type:complete len:389 (-) Transcript_3118:358-1524(-)
MLFAQDVWCFACSRAPTPSAAPDLTTRISLMLDSWPAKSMASRTRSRRSLCTITASGLRVGELDLGVHHRHLVWHVIPRLDQGIPRRLHDTRTPCLHPSLFQSSKTWWQARSSSRTPPERCCPRHQRSQVPQSPKCPRSPSQRMMTERPQQREGAARGADEVQKALDIKAANFLLGQDGHGDLSAALSHAVRQEELAPKRPNRLLHRCRNERRPLAPRTAHHQRDHGGSNVADGDALPLHGLHRPHGVKGFKHHVGALHVGDRVDSVPPDVVLVDPHGVNGANGMLANDSQAQNHALWLPSRSTRVVHLVGDGRVHLGLASKVTARGVCTDGVLVLCPRRLVLCVPEGTDALGGARHHNENQLDAELPPQHAVQKILVHNHGIWPPCR